MHVWLFVLFSSKTQEDVVSFGAIDSMLTQAACMHKVNNLLAVNLQNNKLSQTAIHPAALTQKVCINY